MRSRWRSCLGALTGSFFELFTANFAARVHTLFLVIVAAHCRSERYGTSRSFLRWPPRARAALGPRTRGRRSDKSPACRQTAPPVNHFSSVSAYRPEVADDRSAEIILLALSDHQRAPDTARALSVCALSSVPKQNDGPPLRAAFRKFELSTHRAASVDPRGGCDPRGIAARAIENT